jgi:oxaloacetate decarboxylase
VDGLFIAGGLTRAQLDAISTAVRIPLLLGGVPPDLLDRDYLASRRVRIALQGHQPFAAAVQAVYATLKALRDGTPPAKLEGVAPPAMMKRMLRSGDYESWTTEFLGG